MSKKVDVDNVLQIEINKAILKTLQGNPAARLVNLDEPSARIINIDELSLDDIKGYLQQLPTIMWADWYISSKDRLEQAAKWFEIQISNLQSYISSNKNK